MAMTESIDQRPSTLRNYLRVLWRRKWVVLLPLVLDTVVAVSWLLRHQPLYPASSEPAEP
jgi:uncharacterized protein involved in exopolysaccharide biosynthesis